MGTALGTAHTDALADVLTDALGGGALEGDGAVAALDEPTAAGSFAATSLLAVAQANGRAAPNTRWSAVCAARESRGSV